MRASANYLIKVIATGFLVLVLLSLPLFWARWLCEFTLINMMPQDAMTVRIEPSGLVPPDIETDPNVVSPSSVIASTRPAASFFLGIVDYLEARGPRGRRSNIYCFLGKENHQAWIYFDKKIGQIVCYYTEQESRIPDNTLMVRQVQLYAGPEGVSDTPAKSLGRFFSPLVGREAMWWDRLVVYDKKLRRFFAVNFHERTIIKGPQLPKDDFHEPIDIGSLATEPDLCSLRWLPPHVRPSGEDMKEARPPAPAELKPIVERDYRYPAGQYVLVLDESGRIDLLDRETLEFAGTAGRLPAPETLFLSKERITPKDLLAYKVLPLALNTDHEYRGMFVASVSREGTALALGVFDETGKLSKTDHSKAYEYKGSYAVSRRDVRYPSSRAVYFYVPWAPVLTITKYLLENIHPPLLSVVSYFTAYSFEAAAGHRALFILPNSFVAMKGRDISQNTVFRFYIALLIMLPSIILAILLAWRVAKDATVVGLSENARTCWVIGTIAFGLPAYITYRLTRPKIGLVTCANCGRLRRPDMQRCHRCGSKWHVPQLSPPTWRVVDT